MLTLFVIKCCLCFSCIICLIFFSLLEINYLLIGTTRTAKLNEVDGVDYTFLTEEEFEELEKSGALLESGVFDGLFINFNASLFC